MYASKTVLVVGAGASVDFGFPTGDSLKDQLAQKLSNRAGPAPGSVTGDQTFLDAAVYLAQRDQAGVASFRRAANQIANAMPLAPSIDNYLDAHSGNSYVEVMGKLAIVSCILEAERKSLLYARAGQPVDLSSLKGTWYPSLAKTLFEGVSLQDVDKVLNNVTFVIFNYDRCVEVFLFNALRVYYGIAEKHAASIVDQASFYHPYGVVGRLPWQKSIDESFASTEVAFGEDLDVVRMVEVASGIRTFTERNVDPTFLLNVRTACLEASTLVYLGFAFAAQNMELLSVHELFPQSVSIKDVYATTYGISSQDQVAIRNAIINALSYENIDPNFINDDLHVNFLDGTCTKLFSDFSRSITS